MTLGVAIVGCGLIGTKRAQALAGQKLVVCADLDPARAERLAGAHGAHATSSWAEAVKQPDVDIVVVATTNDALVPVSLAAIQNAKHVLVEKPAARTVADIRSVIEAARKSRVLVRWDSTTGITRPS